jgi:hypothetical protein
MVQAFRASSWAAPGGLLSVAGEFLRIPSSAVEGDEANDIIMPLPNPWSIENLRKFNP